MKQRWPLVRNIASSNNLFPSYSEMANNDSEEEAEKLCADLVKRKKIFVATGGPEKRKAALWKARTYVLTL